MWTLTPTKGILMNVLIMIDAAQQRGETDA